MIIGIAAITAAIHFNQTHFGKVHVMSEKKTSGIEYWKKIVVVMGGNMDISHRAHAYLS